MVKKIEPKICNNCFNDMELRAISSFDHDGTKHGCIWFCQFCGNHNISNIITVTDKNKDLVKPAITFFEIQLFRNKINKELIK